MAKRGTFAFELSKPSKKGVLMKQGSIHKAFKYRYFILYPGFLVYYDTETKWKVDLAKGETLGNRIGAIKLKNGTVSVARDAPKGCKFGLIVHAPDPVNKRQSYLLNAVNKGDRDDWISAVRDAIPNSKTPQPQKKDVACCQRPKVVRQDTADAAALLDTGDIEEEKETTSIDSHLVVRHDTSDIAALQDKVPEDSGSEEEEEGQGITSFDDEMITTALGQKENGRNDSSDEETGTDVPLPQTTPTSDIITNGHATPTEKGTTGTSVEDKNGEQLDTEKEITSSMNLDGTVEVVTTVKVQTRSSDEEDEVEEKLSDSDMDDRFRRASAEVSIAEVKTALTVTMVRENTIDVQETDSETDEDSNGDGSLTNIHHNSDPKENGVLPTKDLPSTDPPNKDPIQNGIPTEDSTEHSPEPETPSSPAKPPTPPTPTTPCITIEKVKTLGKTVSEDTMTIEEEEMAAKALRAKCDKRRSSAAPFIEKKGFLYKEGGQRKTWKLRYFILQPGMFTYYKTSTSTKPLGEVKLKNLQVRYPSADERRQSFQFTVHTESSWNKRKDYVTAAQSNAEMKEWITAFKLAGQKNTSPAATPPDSGEEETVPATS